MNARADAEGIAEEVGNGADIAVEAFGNKLNVKNVKSLNTMATLAILVVVCVIAYGGYMHQQEAKESGAAFVAAVKEQTVSMREQTAVMRESNCLQSYQGPPAEKRSFCQNISR